MSENAIEVNDVTCHLCGNHLFNKYSIEKGIYACTTDKCYGIEVKCNRCNAVFPDSEFGKHGDVYECKKCGTVHWGYTDFMRNRESLMALLKGVGSKLDDISRRL